MSTETPWYQINDASELGSPALLFYPDRIRSNIELMIAIAGGTDRLRPHIKTHKNAEIIKMQQESGIVKFKCATLTEAQLLGRCRADDVLLAMQPAGPAIDGFFMLTKRFPDTRFSTLVDNARTLKILAEKAKENKIVVRLWLDLNVGMHRTGILPGKEALELCRAMHEDPWIEFSGLHAYDGHIRDPELHVRKVKCQQSMAGAIEMKKALEKDQIAVHTIIAGGSPTFGIHAENKELQLSPGTTLLWDAGYADTFKDLPFRIAACLLTRVISKPKAGIVCTDLGHKSVASEMSMPRILFPEQSGLKQVGHSEEHLVLESDSPENYYVGQELYAIPKHICPTVSKYSRAQIIKDNHRVDTWTIEARNHEIEPNIVTS